jgi:hypothetical protein
MEPPQVDHTALASKADSLRANRASWRPRIGPFEGNPTATVGAPFAYKLDMRRIFIAVLSALAAAGIPGCGGELARIGPLAPSAGDPALSVTLETAHYLFHYSSNDRVDADRQEAFHDWAVVQFGIVVPAKIHYYNYLSVDHMQALTGEGAMGRADVAANAIHSIWEWHAHEAVHIYTAIIGRPSDFFNEGIAVGLAVDPLGGRNYPLWNNAPVHTVARTALRGGQVPPLATIVETDAFRRLRGEVSYPVAGSFVEFLVDTRGIGPILTFFRTGNRLDSRATIERNFESAIGVTLQQAEQEWLAFLG